MLINIATRTGSNVVRHHKTGAEGGHFGLSTAYVEPTSNLFLVYDLHKQYPLV